MGQRWILIGGASINSSIRASFSVLEATLKCCPPSPLGLEYRVVVVKMQLWTLEGSVEGPWKDSHNVACVMKSLQASVSVSICHMKKSLCTEYASFRVQLSS
jgi:hypothetical protein